MGKTGAAVLAAGGALRSGCGLVTVATPEPCLPIVAAARAEAMTEPLPATAGGGLDEAALPRLLDLAAARDAVVLGPGLGQDPGTRALVRAFVRACPVPLVIDADGLNALAPAGGEAGDLGALRRETPTILTPHPGEMARLAGRRAAEVQRERPGTAVGLARETGAIVVLKGERTLVAEPAGRAAIAATGNPGLATGGTGDVLAGVVGSLLARHGALLSATAAVVVHGRAGDLAARERGEEGLTAGDVVEALPAAIESLRRGAGGGDIREVTSRSEAETAEVAETMAAAFRGGEVVLLSGELGAGKTAFVRGLARGLGADPDEVASPTFVLLTAYPGTAHPAPRRPLPAAGRRGRARARARGAARARRGARRGVGGAPARRALERAAASAPRPRGGRREGHRHRGRGLRRASRLLALAAAVASLAGCPGPKPERREADGVRPRRPRPAIG